MPRNLDAMITKAKLKMREVNAHTPLHRHLAPGIQREEVPSDGVRAVLYRQVEKSFVSSRCPPKAVRTLSPTHYASGPPVGGTRQTCWVRIGS